MFGFFTSKKEKKILSKEEWITKYGSKELKLRMKHGYDFESFYVKERWKREFPNFKGFTRSTFIEVETPSIEALKLLDKVKNSVYFDENEYIVYIVETEFKWRHCGGIVIRKKGEAILIENYLDGYNIWQPV